MDEPTRDFPQGAIRVSDAERDAAVAELGQHYRDGRLTVEEFDERSGQAFAAKTGDQLHALFADLPSSQVAPAMPSPPVTAPPRRGLSVRRTLVLCVVGYLLLGNVVGALGSVVGGDWGSAFGAVFPSVIILGVIFALIARPRSRPRRR